MSSYFGGLADAHAIPEGNEGTRYRLHNIATEATLQKLLDVISANNGSGVSSKLSDGYKEIIKSVDIVSKNLDQFGLQSKTLAEEATDQIQRMGKTTSSSMAKFSNLVGLAASDFSKSFLSMIKAGDSTAGLYSLMNGNLAAITMKIPVLGSVLQLGVIGLENYLGVMNSSISTFQLLSEHGITFGSNLLDINKAASAANVSIDAMTAILAHDSQDLSVAFGNASLGAKAIADVGEQFNNLGSADIRQLGRELRGLGYSNEQMMEGASLFYDLNKYNSSLRTMSANDQATATANLLKEINDYSSVTGKSRKEIEEHLRAQSKQYDLNATVNQFKGDGVQQSAREAIMYVGDQLGDAAKTLLMSTYNHALPPESVRLMMQGGGNSSLARFYTMMKMDADRLSRGQKSLINENTLKDLADQIKPEELDAFGAWTRKLAGAGLSGADELTQMVIGIKNLQQATRPTPEEIQAKDATNRQWLEISNFWKAFGSEIDLIKTKFVISINNLLGSDSNDPFAHLGDFIHNIDKTFSQENINGWMKYVKEFFDNDFFKNSKSEFIKLKDTTVWLGEVLMNLAKTINKYFPSTMSSTTISNGEVIKGSGWNPLSNTFSDKSLSKPWTDKLKGDYDSHSDVPGFQSDELRSFMATALARAKEDGKSDEESKKLVSDGISEFLRKNYQGVELDNMNNYMKDKFTPLLQSIQQYKDGGVASGPGAGYLAMLHGTEAVIPLSDNRSIPVDLSGFANNFVSMLDARDQDKKEAVIKSSLNTYGDTSKVDRMVDRLEVIAAQVLLLNTKVEEMNQLSTTNGRNMLSKLSQMV